MGQSQPNKQSFLKEWTRVGMQDSKLYQSHINTLSFGSSIDLYTNGQYEVAVVHKIFQSEMHFIKELRRLEIYQSLQDTPGLVQLLDIQKYEESNLCSNLFKIDAIFEYGNPLPTMDWSSFLQQTIHILIELQNRNRYHGDLRPQNFMLFNEKIKLLLPNVDQYSRFLGGFEDHCYLSPELFVQLGRRIFKPEYNREKSDVFTLGLVCLEMILHQNIQGIYDFQEYQINQILLDSLIHKIKNPLIEKMLSFREDQRPTFMQIYESSIVELMGIKEESIQYDSKQQFDEIHGGQINNNANPSLQGNSQKLSELQYLTISQSPNNRYSNKPSMNTSKSRPESRIPEYGFLHEQVHIPCNPGSDFLDSSRHRKENQTQQPSINSMVSPQRVSHQTNSTQQNRTQSIQKQSAVKQQPKIIASSAKSTVQKEKKPSVSYKKKSTPLMDISNLKNAKPQLLKSNRNANSNTNRSKSPINRAK